MKFKIRKGFISTTRMGWILEHPNGHCFDFGLSFEEIVSVFNFSLGQYRKKVGPLQ